MTKGLFALLMAGSLMVPAHHPRAGKRKHRRPWRRTATGAPARILGRITAPAGAESRHDAMVQFRVCDKGPEDGHPIGSPT